MFFLIKLGDKEFPQTCLFIKSDSLLSFSNYYLNILLSFFFFPPLPTHVSRPTFITFMKEEIKENWWRIWKVTIKKKSCDRSTWVAQWIKLLTLAQVMVSWFVDLRPSYGSVLTAWSLLWILSRYLSLPLPRLDSVSLSKINKQTNRQTDRQTFKRKQLWQWLRHDRNFCISWE